MLEYWIWIMIGGQPVVVNDAVLAVMQPTMGWGVFGVDVAEQLGLCKHCPKDGALAHAIDEKTGKKYCPFLLHDAINPKWKTKNIVGMDK